MNTYLVPLGNRGCWKIFGQDKSKKMFSITFFTSEDPRGKTKEEIEKRYLILYRDLKNMHQALKLLGKVPLPKTKRGCKKMLKELLCVN